MVQLTQTIALLAAMMLSAVSSANTYKTPYEIGSESGFVYSLNSEAGASAVSEFVEENEEVVRKLTACNAVTGDTCRITGVYVANCSNGEKRLTFHIATHLQKYRRFSVKTQCPFQNRQFDGGLIE